MKKIVVLGLLLSLVSMSVIANDTTQARGPYLGRSKSETLGTGITFTLLGGMVVFASAYDLNNGADIASGAGNILLFLSGVTLFAGGVTGILFGLLQEDPPLPELEQDVQSMAIDWLYQ